MDADVWEEARLAALERYEIPDTEPETKFDEIAILASLICDAPMAVVNFVDGHRAWFKATVGLDEIRELPREMAFCTETIRRRATMVLPDTLADPQFANNPLVTGSAGLRFYAGAPLITSDGHAIGTLCVLDRQPRALSQDQVRALQMLRSQVMSQLEDTPAPYTATVLFRILQEALTNVVRHAQAQSIDAGIAHAHDAGGITMTVQDHGVGIDESIAARPTSLGLIGMRERALALGGTVSIERLPERGTMLRLRLPQGNARA